MNDMLDDIPDDELRKKLQSYEEKPDDDFWEKLDAAMPAPNEELLSTKLKNYHENPDDDVWTAIEKDLDAYKVWRGFEHFGVAASVIAILLLLYPALFSPVRSDNVTSLEQFPSSKKIETQKAELSQDKSQKLAPEENKLESVFFDSTHSSEAVRNDKLYTKVEESTKNTNPIPEGNLIAKNSIQSTGIQSGNNSEKNIDSQNPKNISKKSNVLSSYILKTNQAKNVQRVNDVQLNSSQKESFMVMDSINQNEVLAKQNTNSSTQRYTELATTIKNIPDSIKTETEKIVKADSLVIKPLIEKAKAEKETKKKIIKPSGLYALLMPTLGYQQVKPVQDDDIFIESLERVSAFSPKRLGIRCEIGFEKQLTSRWAVHTAVLYYQRKQTIAYRYNDPEHIDVIQVAPDSLDYIVTPKTLSSTFEYEVKNVGALLGINYNINGKRFQQKIGVGGELHKPLHSRNPENQASPNLYFFSNVYYRISYRLSDRFDAMIQPTFNYAMQVDQRINAPFYVKPYGLGLNFGIYYHFKFGQ